MELYSDSRYVIDALEKRWVYGWKQRGWVKTVSYTHLDVYKRQQYDLRKAREREHLLQGLLIAQDNIDVYKRQSTRRRYR